MIRILFIFLILLVQSNIFSETIILKDGTKIKCQVLGHDSDAILVDCKCPPLESHTRKKNKDDSIRKKYKIDELCQASDNDMFKIPLGVIDLHKIVYGSNPNLIKKLLEKENTNLIKAQESIQKILNEYPNMDSKVDKENVSEQLDNLEKKVIKLEDRVHDIKKRIHNMKKQIHVD